MWHAMANDRGGVSVAGNGPDWPVPEPLLRRVLNLGLRKTGAEEITAALSVGGHPFMCITQTRPPLPCLGQLGELRYMATSIMVEGRCVGSLGIRFLRCAQSSKPERVLKRLAGVLARLVYASGS